MTSLSCTALILLTLVPVAFGNADILPRTLMDRIEALERRDTEQIARIVLLEEQALVSKEKLDLLSASNEELQKQLAYQAKKVHDQEDIIADLRKDVEHYKTLTQDSMRHYNILQSKVQKMDKSLDDTVQNYQDNLEIFKKMKPETNSWTNKIETQTDVPELTTNTATENGENDRSDVELKKEDSAKTSVHDTDVDTVKDTLNAGTDEDILHYMTHHSIRSTTNQVAFHAVHLQATIQAPQIQDTVKFEYLYLNQGNGYYDQHSLFIAPQPGLYLFSTTIMSVDNIGHNEVVASIVKNGVRLGNVICTPNVRKQSLQSSVTMVTQLNVGDEVWVIFVGPDGGQIWGNGFTSFAGILIM